MIMSGRAGLGRTCSCAQGSLISTPNAGVLRLPGRCLR
uniref:Uncharacterized protein n=1 Tax=Arundo donax TaxID=35708 RepID=A0A0A8Y7W7_ARUDO